MITSQKRNKTSNMFWNEPQYEDWNVWANPHLPHCHHPQILRREDRAHQMVLTWILHVHTCKHAIAKTTKELLLGCKLCCSDPDSTNIWSISWQFNDTFKWQKHGKRQHWKVRTYFDTVIKQNYYHTWETKNIMLWRAGPKKLNSILLRVCLQSVALYLACRWPLNHVAEDWLPGGAVW